MKTGNISKKKKKAPPGAMMAGPGNRAVDQLGVTAQPNPCTLAAVFGITMDQKKVLCGPGMRRLPIESPRG